MVEDPEYLVPPFQKSTSIQLPECPKTDILVLVEEYKDLFQTLPSLTDLVCYFIPTTKKTARIPLQHVLVQYCEIKDSWRRCLSSTSSQKATVEVEDMIGCQSRPLKIWRIYYWKIREVERLSCTFHCLDLWRNVSNTSFHQSALCDPQSLQSETPGL